jgi:uridine phosphorylase
MKSKYPILEFDNSKHAVIEPKKAIKNLDVPVHCVLCFSYDLIEKLNNDGKLKHLTDLHSCMGLHPVYEINLNNKRIALFHPGIGASLVAGLFEEIIAMGMSKIIACGGAGVLDKNIAVGHLIIPISAVRDEGTSYHYIEPSRNIEPSKEAIDALEKTLNAHNCKYLLSKTWTTDAFYRETKQKVELRKSEGCLTVEMECSALCAVAKFRGVIFAQLLYGGDDVSCEEWDPRKTTDRLSIYENALWLAIEACSIL